uniref:Putative ubinuclein nuclear protein n=1 Tax=Anopheles triannulatus TaxID=58253 RepID=A0A2M4A733_9DIPT
MSDVKRVTLTTISDVVRKGGGAGGGTTTMSTGSTIMASSSSFGGGAFSQFELPNAAATAASPFASSSSSMFGGAAGGKDAMGGGTPGNNGSSGSGSSKKQKTVRLELNLFEPTADSFPEFNFSKLIHEEQKRLKKLQKKHEEEANGFLSDPELDNDVARMARELELKYGSGSAYASSKSSKHARPSKLDYCDRGAGYDEEDSFIDNSEAYDELMPQEIETVGGGFYINSGQLEFKQLSNFERPEDAQRMPKPKKRALSTSSESSDGEAEPETAEAKSKSQETTNAQPPGDKVVPNHKDLGAQPQQQQPPVQPMECQSGTEDDKATSSVLVSSGTTVAATGSQDEKVRLNGHVSKKQKLNDNGQSAAPKGGGASVIVEAMVEEKLVHSTASGALPVPEGEKDGKSNGVKGTGKPTNAASSTKKDEAVLSTEGGVKTIKTTTVKDMLRAKRDSLRKMEQEKKGRSSGSSRVSSSEAEEDGDDGGGDEDDEEDDDDNDDDDDDDDEDDEDEDDDEDEGRSEKNSHDTRSEVDIGSDSESSRESTGQKAVANVSASVPSTMPNSTVTTTANAVASTIVSAAAADPPMMNGGPMETEQQQQQQQQTEERKRKECKLPDGIGESLRKDIGTLLELANGQAGGGGKLNYFDSKVADLMLQIDEACRSYGGSGSNSTRNVVFRYLEAHLSISRQSLQLKLKKIRIRWLENRSKSTLGRLESTVNQMMPAILAKYELDCAKVQEIRAAQQAQAAATAAAATSAVSTVSGSSSATTSITNGAEKPDAAPSSVPQVRNPKKRFPWNDRSSVLLWDLFTLRSDMYGLVRPRNETQEEFVAEYLRTRVVPLWPKGWIRYEDLQKELDRRKKVLAKIQGAAAAAASTGAVTTGGVKEPHSKKPPIIMLSPLTSPGPPESTGTKMNGVPSSATDMSMSISGSQRSTSSQSTSGSKSKQTDSERSPAGATGGIVATSTASHPYMGDGLSPNHSSLHKRTSDHSISNIMNSPPLPPPASTTMDSRHSPGEANRNASGRSNHTGNRRCSFDDDHSAGAQAQQRLEPVVVSSTSSKDGSSPRRVHFPGITDGKGSSSQHHHHHHRRASREEDSDSSIEIIAEYSMTAGGAPGGGGGGGGSKGSGGMSGSNMSPMGGTSLPVLNREKYKNLIAGKTKSGSTTSSHAGSPIATTDLPSPMGTPGGSSGSGLKYSKHSPAATVSGSTSASPSFNSSMSNPVGGGATGLPFAIPSGAVSGGGSSLDIVDVQQIMKDLKELQELQQHHSVGGNSGSSSRKVPDTSTLQNQQQQQQQQPPHNVQLPLAQFLPRS